MRPQFKYRWEGHADFWRVILAGCLLFRLHENLRHGEEAQNGGDEGNASRQIGKAEIIAVDAADRILADGRDQKAEQNGHPAFPDGTPANRRGYRQTEKDQRENLWRADIADGPVCQRFGGGHHHQRRGDTTDRRTQDGSADGLAGFALLGHRIAVKCGRCVFRRPRNIEQDGSDRAAVGAGTIDHRKQHDALGRLQIGRERQQDGCQRQHADTRDGAEQHAADHAKDENRNGDRVTEESRTAGEELFHHDRYQRF